MAEQSVIVAGGGVAGLRAAQQLRAAGWTGHLGVVGAEPHLPYNRPPLTKDALRHGVDLESLTFPLPDADIDWRLGTRIVASDLAARRLVVERPDGSGEKLSFDGLVIATGVGPRRLPLGGPHSWRHTVRTPEDAAALRRRLVDRPRVAVIGAGFIGCEVAAAAATLGCEVTVVEPLGTPLERAVGRVLGAEVQRRHEAHGVRFVLGRTVAAVEGNAAGPTGLLLDGGQSVAADVVVEAVGSVPNTDWLAGQGLDLANGVLCDHDLHPLAGGAALRHVVALGDVARFPCACSAPTPCGSSTGRWPGTVPAERPRRWSPDSAARNPTGRRSGSCRASGPTSTTTGSSSSVSPPAGSTTCACSRATSTARR